MTEKQIRKETEGTRDSQEASLIVGCERQLELYGSGCGTEIARLMKYFKTADPDDMSQGALSERVRFLKKDEKGRKIMCEVTDEFIKIGEEIGEQRGIEIGEQRGEQRGIEIGEKSGAKKEKRNIARQLASMGMPLLQIATAVNASKKQVGRWVSEV